ncbi:MAG: DUF2878 domain-containing protein [Gammaproteobacteria bacterium]|nr:DUF2878 domain-containing protein [Gammaproteobacteria bacterium]
MIINFVGYYVAWLGLVLFGNVFVPFALALLVIHLLGVVTHPSRQKAELKLIVSVAMLGSLVDGLLTQLSIFHFHRGSLLPLLSIPYWLVILWACFAATLAHSLKVLSKSKILQALVGAVFAPLSYVAGYKFDAVQLGYSVFSTYLVLATVWAVIIVVCFSLKDKFLSEVSCD